MTREHVIGCIKNSDLISECSGPDFEELIDSLILTIKKIEGISKLEVTQVRVDESEDYDLYSSLAHYRLGSKEVTSMVDQLVMANMLDLMKIGSLSIQQDYFDGGEYLIFTESL